MDEEKGFTIGDRRGGESESAERPGETAGQPHAESAAEPVPNQPVPPINFVSFVYSLAMSALMCLGEQVGEGAAGEPPHPAPGHGISCILTRIQSKPQSNSTSGGEALLYARPYTRAIRPITRAKAPQTR